MGRRQGETIQDAGRSETEIQIQRGCRELDAGGWILHNNIKSTPYSHHKERKGLRFVIY